QIDQPEAPAHLQVGFFFSSRRRHTRSVSAFLLNRSSDLQLNGLETLVIIMVANKYAFLQITRRRFLNEWEAFKKVISRRNIRRRITIPLTLSNLKLLRRITRTENILHRNLRLLRVRDRKSGSAGMPRPISYAVFCLKKKKNITGQHTR